MLLKSGREVIVLSFLFFAIAAALNACMDTLVHHFGISVFQKLNPQFWWPEISWKNKYLWNNPDYKKRKWIFGLIDKPVFLTDGWHLFKSLMIVFICLSMAFYEPIIQEYRWGAWQDHWHIRFMGAYIHPGMFNIPVALIVYGTAWNVIFNLFYNKLLLKK